MEDASTGEAPDRDFVTALARGLEVINCFRSDSPELTLSEVAQRTGLNVATVRRSLFTLQQLGYVKRRERRFLLGPKVLTLGASYLESMNLKEVAQHFLVELVDRFHDAASLTVLDRLEVVYIAHVPSDQRVRLGRSVGSRLPAHATSTGIVLLANGPGSQREELLTATPLPTYTSRTPTTREQLEDYFSRALSDDYVVAADTIEYGAIAIAVPVRDRQGRVIAALNCATTTSQVDEAELISTRIDPLREAAKKIGSMLERYPALAHSVG